MLNPTRLARHRSLPLTGGHGNWHGAPLEVIHAAVSAVDKAEKRASRADEREPAWRRLVRADGRRDESLGDMGPVRRLALEMAVTEELERRALAGEAARLEGDSAEASEVAHIADNMFVPAAITEWIDRRRQRSDPV